MTKLLALTVTLLLSIITLALAVPVDVADIDGMRARGMSEHAISASLRSRYSTPSHSHRRHARYHKRSTSTSGEVAFAAPLVARAAAPLPLADAHPAALANAEPAPEARPDARTTKQAITEIMHKVLKGAKIVGREPREREGDAYEGMEELVVKPRGEHHW